MRLVRAPFALVGVFFVAAGILLVQYGQSRGLGAGTAFGLVYAGAGAVLIGLGFKPNVIR